MSTPPRDALDRLVALAETGELDRVCSEQGVRLLVAFGSATDPERVDAAHDLDLAVLPGDGFDLLGLLAALGGVLGYGNVDVMDLRRASVVARDRALTASVPLYEAERGLFASRQMAAALERMDTAWLRRLDLELMAG